MPQRGFQFHEYEDEYSLPGDEIPKPQKLKRETPDETVHFSRGKPRPRVRSIEETYSEGGYQYGKRPKGWKR